ncbi:lipopolysaccharide core heptose(II)-phosphate phosphatase PmrG [Pseudomonas citri]|uniref:lipopolysaccharide core heptose(II)-phosphate phosphatase PmrG n=1 Tax=Pseudomonas citri TaxID=2978349 RepID=UPI0021B4F185|nr:histidine phosphatase family protein [Pseudomonas citri]
MELRLSLFGLTRSLEASRFARYRTAMLVLACAPLLIALGFWCLSPAAVPDLAHGNRASDRALADGWAKGEMIVLVRHVERCDRSKATCLNDREGITDRARAVAVSVGARFEQLGLDNADIYNSPSLRTAQTAGYMFNKVSAGDDWLANCRHDLLRNALARKVPGRNLILVTHSECMQAMETALQRPTSAFGYGASLFVSAAQPKTPRLLGFIEASDWRSVKFQ